MVLACLAGTSSVDVTDSARLTLVAVSTESMVSEAMRGEDRVRSPAWD